MGRDWRKAAKEKNNKFLRFFGVSHSTLSQRLKSILIYEFFKMRDGTMCHRCGAPVEVGNHSLDHSESFWDSEDPWESFFDLSKCFMSHKICNFKHGGSEAKANLKKRYQDKKDKIRGIYAKNIQRDHKPTDRAECVASRDIRKDDTKEKSGKNSDGDAF